MHSRMATGVRQFGAVLLELIEQYPTFDDGAPSGPGASDGLRLRKHKPIISKKVRDSARGEECTLQIVGECLGTTDTTVLAHLPSEWKGWANKSPDVGCAVYACDACHAIMDGRRWSPEWEVFRSGDEVKRARYMLRALQRTVVRMVEKGVVVIK